MGAKYDGSLLFDTKISTDNFKKGLSNIKSIAASASKATLATFIAATVAAGAAIGAIGTKAIKAYADYEQLVGGVETLFGKNAKTVQKYANEAYKTAGMSANAYMETITGFSASLLQSLGGDTAKAAEYGNQAVIDMSDNANKMGTDIQRIQDAYQGFAKQNYTMLDNLKLGYGGTKTEMERLLADAEAIKAKNGEIASYSVDSFADITEAIHVVQTEMGITGTTAKEASTTIQGSLGMVKGAWENLLTGLTDPTQDLDALIQNLFDSLITAGENLEPRVEQVLIGISKVIPKLAPPLIEAVGNLIPKLLPVVAEGAAEVVDCIIDTVIGLLPKLPQLGSEILNAIYSGLADSDSLAATILTPIVGALASILEHTELIKASIIGIGAAVAAYKIGSLIEGWVKKLTIANQVVNAYTAELVKNQATSWAGATANTLLAGTMDTLSLTVGVLTGKVELATAKTLIMQRVTQTLASPIGMLGLATAVVGVVSALITYARNADTVSNRLRELTKKHEEAIKAIDDTAKSEITQAETAIQLKNHLYELEEQIKSGKLSDEEAKKAKEDFTAAAYNLNEIIPGIIINIGNETNGYYIQRTEVDALTQSFYELAYAKAMVNAYQSKINKTAEAIVEINGELNALENNKNDKARNIIAIGLLGKESNYVKLKKEKKKYENELKGYSDAMSEYQKKISELTKPPPKKNPPDDPLGGLRKSVEKGAKETADSVTKTAKKAEDKLKKQRERELRHLKNSLESGEISESQYYEKLAAFRDKYFDEGSEEWEDYTTEIAKYNKKLADEAIEEQEKIIEKISSMQKELASKLRENTGSLLKTTTVTIKGIGENGADETYTNYSLADIEAENKKLERYKKAVLGLKDLGNVSAGIFTHISQLSIDEGTKLAETILNADEENRERFLKSYRENDKLSNDIASELNPILNQEKFEEEGISAAKGFSEGYKKQLESERESFIKILEDRFGTLPEYYYTLGTDAADEFEKGFFERVPEMMERFRQCFRAEVNAFAAQISATLEWKNRLAASASGGNTYSTTYSFNASKQTVSEQIHEAKKASTLERLRGGY